CCEKAFLASIGRCEQGAERMTMKELLITVLTSGALAMYGTPANAQISEHAARNKARSVARSQLHLDPQFFLDVHRDEALEEELASVVGGLAGSEFIYRI